jgi:hypothetical protein
VDRATLAGASLAGGILVTAVTGLIPARTLVGAVHYGFPMAWLIRRVVAPEFFPWRVNRVGLVVDVAVWTLVVSVALVLYERLRDGSAGTSSG